MWDPLRPPSQNTCARYPLFAADGIAARAGPGTKHLSEPIVRPAQTPPVQGQIPIPPLPPTPAQTTTVPPLETASPSRGNSPAQARGVPLPLAVAPSASEQNLAQSVVILLNHLPFELRQSAKLPAPIQSHPYALYTFTLRHITTLAKGHTSTNCFTPPITGQER